MCTVSYIPQGKGQFILSSNRDENASRSPQNISFWEEGQVQLLFPRDSTAGGTWIAVSNKNQVVCLLNGAFVKHKHRPPYKRSRGIMVLDFFKYSSATDFFATYDFDEMEAFTFIIFERDLLYEFRWDGIQKHIKKLDTTIAHLWSSATLYPPEIQQKRLGWFEDWLKDRKDFSLAAILNLHQTGGDGSPYYDFVMNRMNIVQTVSITNIVRSDESIEMHYHDLLNQQTKVKRLNLEVKT